LVLSHVTGRSLRIDDIRLDDPAPGLRDYEASLLRLLERLSNGTVVEINETGTRLRYTPGVLLGGVLEHDCGTARGISYFLEPLVCLALFAKKVRRSRAAAALL
jgi:RNA 3'-terminal phosphate cyclase-like protein